MPTPEWRGPCHLSIHEVEESTGYTPEYVCEVAVHEEGHLHGQDHSPDPANVMYGGVLAPGAVPACVGAAVPNFDLSGPKAGAPPPRRHKQPRRHRRYFATSS